MVLPSVRKIASLLALAFLLIAGTALAGDNAFPPLTNWTAPATFSPHGASRGASTMGDISEALPFVAVTPCRQYDSRNTSALPDNTPRAVTITGAPCGLPVTAAAVSLNVTVFDILGQGANAVLKAGTSSPPTTAWINYPPGQGQIGNAGVMPLSGSGQIVFQVNQGGGSIDFTIDVNGYYAPAGVGTENTFLGQNAGNFTMTGGANTGFGHNAFSNNSTGVINTAIGNFALWSNTTGSANTATGNNALAGNNGSNNTANGAFALYLNTTGSGNTASGFEALYSNTTGGANTATGWNALHQNTTSFNSTAIGANALANTTGFGNTGIGVNAGVNLTSGFDNICIGNPGVAGESGTIRIGTVGTQTATFVAGVNGVTTGGTGTPVLIDASGQLGTISSSARFKDEIQDMGESTEGLLKLRPVTFRYKAQPEGRTQFGLIGEEVEKVMPELVVCSSSGEVDTVLYHEMPAMLLNELQKQQREIQELKSELSALRAVIGQK